MNNKAMCSHSETATPNGRLGSLSGSGGNPNNRNDFRQNDTATLKSSDQ